MESFSTRLLENNGSTEAIINMTTSINPSTTEVLPENPKTTEIFSTRSSENNGSTEANINMTTSIDPSTTSVTLTTSINPSTASVTLSTEKQLLNESTTFLHVENSTISVTTEYETSTTMIETTIHLTTTEATTSTTVVPADCPVLKDCPFDYFAFARKLDNRGCPTCNCLRSNKSNITCPSLTCQACLYGHYTDPHGVYIFI